MRKEIAGPCAALILLATSFSGSAAAGIVDDPVGGCGPAGSPCFRLASTIAFTSTRDNPTDPLIALEVYLINPDGTNPRRLTENTDGDAFAALSPDGKKIVFDSNRNRAESEVRLCDNVPPVPDPSVFRSDLFLMNTDGSEQTLLARGSSASWSSDNKNIAFHASASGAGCLSRTDPGGAAGDSDIFVANVDDLLAGAEQPRNITNTPDKIDDDPDWSPAAQRIVYTAHDVGDDIPNPPSGFLSNSAELYLINPDGTDRQRLTYTSVPGDGQTDVEERAAAWSPQGDKILYSCRIGGGRSDFEICVINADGTGQLQLTDNNVADLSGTWSPDGQQMVFQRLVAGQGPQLFTMAPRLNPDGTLPTATQLTHPPGLNLFPHWGELRVRVTG
jgi:Tol biopolymer transport system component